MFTLVEHFSTSFNPTRMVFDHSLEHLMGDDSAFINVIMFENWVIGYYLAFDHYAFYANGRVTWVKEIMVIKDLRGKGIGNNLMKPVEQWAVSRKSKLIGLATRRASPFYKAIGYEESAIFFRKMIEE